eukprot:155515_1
MESSTTPILVPHLETAERNAKYSRINENPAFLSPSRGINLVFCKSGSAPRGRVAQLFSANHFFILVFSSEYDNVKDADTIDIFHLMPHRGINRILVHEVDREDLESSDDVTIYSTHTIRSKSYKELIDFCKAKDDKRAQYFTVANNCHKFCIDFAKYCDIEYGEINFSGMEGCLYGVVNIVQFCHFCVAYHGYRLYVYCTMFFLWSIFATAWWSQIRSFDNPFKSQFDSCATGTYFILFASFLTIILAICDCKKSCALGMNLCAVLFIVGGICYWFGGFAVTGIIRKTLDPVCHRLPNVNTGYCSAFAGIWFTECSLVGLTSIVFGVDMMVKVLNFEIFRRFFNLALLWFTSLVGFFCYAILSTNVPNIKEDAGKMTLGAVAAAYFFMFVISSFYICWSGYKYYVVNHNSDTRWGDRIILDISSIICTCFFGVMLICGYWAMTSYNNTSIERSLLNETDFNHGYLAVYWVGMSFFWMIFLLIVLSDMHIGVPQSVNIRAGWEGNDDWDDSDEFESDD